MKFRIVVLCAALSACASTPAPSRDPVWLARTDANLAADLAACTRESNNVDLNSITSYSDGRYGPAAAMARQVQDGDVNGITMKDVYAAVRDSCMTSKGWKKAG